MSTISWQDALTAGFTNAGNLKVDVQTSGAFSLGTITIPTSNTVVSATITPALSGVMRFMTITTPAMTGTGTATIEIVDSAGGTLFTKAQDESVVSSYGSIVPLTSTMELRATASGTQSSAAPVIYNIYYDK